MVILGRTQMISGVSITDAIKRLMAKGFDGVEICAFDKDWKLQEELFDDSFPEQVKNVIDDVKVKAYSVSAHMDYVASDERYERVKNIIRVAGKINSPIVIITGGMDGKAPDRDTLYLKQVERTKELCKIAKENSVTLAVEFEPNFVVGNTKQVLQLIKDVEHESLKINMDIGHVFLEDPDPMDAILSSRTLVAHAHIENMMRGVHNHIVPYEGDMDLEAYFRQMKTIGFDGFASIDLYQYDYESVAEKSIRTVRDLWISAMPDINAGV